MRDFKFSQISDHLVFSLVTSVAVLSFLTGIVNIGMTSFTGPLSQYIPLWLQQTAGFSGAMTGFLMLASVMGLRKNLRDAWILTMVLLPLTIVQGLIQSSIFSVPLILLSAITLPVIFYRRKRFNRESSLSPTQTAALITVIGVQVYGTVGAFALREGFNQELTLLDAFYYSIVTSSTVGYGDIHAVTPEARMFTISLVILGTTSFAAAAALLISPMIESKLASKFEKIEDEIIEEIKTD